MMAEDIIYPIGPIEEEQPPEVGEVEAVEIEEAVEKPQAGPKKKSELAELFEKPSPDDPDIYSNDLVELDEEDVMGDDIDDLFDVKEEDILGGDISDLTKVSYEDVLNGPSRKPKKKVIKYRRTNRPYPPSGLQGLRG